MKAVVTEAIVRKYVDSMQLDDIDQMVLSANPRLYASIAKWCNHYHNGNQDCVERSVRTILNRVRAGENMYEGAIVKNYRPDSRNFKRLYGGMYDEY